MRFHDFSVIVPSASLPVTEQDYIDHARLNALTIDRQPALIDRKLRAATERAESYLRRSLLTQTIEALYIPDGRNCECSNVIKLPRGKVQGVTSVVSGGGAVAGYRVDLVFGTIFLAAPLPQGAVVEFVSGYGDEAVLVPDQIREGILQYATVLYDDRPGQRETKYESTSQGLPRGVVDLWRPHQIELSG